MPALCFRKESNMIVIDGIKIIGAVFVIIYIVSVIKGSRL